MDGNETNESLPTDGGHRTRRTAYRLPAVMSLDEVAAALGTTREGVHYTEKVALRKLRQALLARGYSPTALLAESPAASDSDQLATRCAALD